MIFSHAPNSLHLVLLQAAGSQEDPYEFFLDLVKSAMVVQLGTAAALYYGCEVGLGYDSGDGFRVVTALFLGYFLRIFVKIELLVSDGDL